MNVSVQSSSLRELPCLLFPFALQEEASAKDNWGRKTRGGKSRWKKAHGAVRSRIECWIIRVVRRGRIEYRFQWNVFGSCLVVWNRGRRERKTDTVQKKGKENTLFLDVHCFRGGKGRRKYSKSRYSRKSSEGRAKLSFYLWGRCFCKEVSWKCVVN